MNANEIAAESATPQNWRMPTLLALARFRKPLLPGQLAAMLLHGQERSAVEKDRP